MELESGRPVWAMGLMSGTSMDGVDAALVLTDGVQVFEFGESLFLPYDDRYRHDMAAAMDAARGMASASLLDPAQWPGEFRRLAAHAVDIHAAAVERLGSVEVVGFHGQTVVHRPEDGVTLQLGDGAELARRTGRITVWDFRSADMKAGGQGAPLAPFFHFALARRMGADRPLAFVNIGGVANLTLVDPAKTAPEEPEALVAFDTGPGNALIDDLMRTRGGAHSDKDGATARRGRVNEPLLMDLLEHEYFEEEPPKSLDRNAFSLPEGFGALSLEDAAATLTEFTAASLARSTALMEPEPARWLISGGGRRNTWLMERLGALVDHPVAPIDEAGFDGDMLEAQAFAYLAVRSLRGLPLSAPGTTGCRAPTAGGRISQP